MDWIAGLLVLASKWALAEKKRVGWWFSIIGNVLIIFLNIKVGLDALAFLGVINVVFCIRGLIVWKEDKSHG